MTSRKVADEVEGGIIDNGGRRDARSSEVRSRRFRGRWVIVNGAICTVMMVEMTARYWRC